MSTEPRFTNKHASVFALGLAVDADKHKLYYASMCGPAITCKSIWAGICANTAKNTYVKGWHYQHFNGQAPIRSVNQTLPGSTFIHLISLSQVNNLIVAIEPGATTAPSGHDYHADPERVRLLEPHMNSIHTRFASILNTQTNIPVLPAWAPIIWQHTHENSDAITTLHAYGDCVGAWVVNLQFDWLTLVGVLLASRQLTLTEPKE